MTGKSRFGLVTTATIATATAAETTAATAAARATTTTAITTAAAAETTATTATGATTTAAETTAATTTATKGRAFFTRACFVDLQRTTGKLLTIQVGDRRFHFLALFHGDETNAPGASGFTIVDQFDGVNFTVVFKSSAYFLFRATPGQIAHIDVLGHS